MGQHRCDLTAPSLCVAAASWAQSSRNHPAGWKWLIWADCKYASLVLMSALKDLRICRLESFQITMEPYRLTEHPYLPQANTWAAVDRLTGTGPLPGRLLAVWCGNLKHKHRERRRLVYSRKIITQSYSGAFNEGGGGGGVILWILSW